MTVDELADWLDKNGCFDDSPWSDFFDKEYCRKCEAIKCTYADVKEKPSYSGEVECAYCEVYGKCKFFPEFDDIPSNKYVIKMWLKEEAE